MEKKFKLGQRVKILFNDFTNTKITSEHAGKTFTIGSVGDKNKGLHVQYFLQKENGETIKHPTRPIDYPFMDVELELVE